MRRQEEKVLTAGERKGFVPLVERRELIRQALFRVRAKVAQEYPSGGMRRMPKVELGRISAAAGASDQFAGIRGGLAGLEVKRCGSAKNRFSGVCECGLPNMARCGGVCQCGRTRKP